ncbi:hypothetical protein QVD17_09009 [Tagetes erecta]|uniref:Uncharacterized protein n=1 Tax=Tagetes erecta TaxID=13708 RepID=A0AAD8L044_TARER|nr:hypothetical protein QVD17_09009 [Tagetes erecta]
MLARDSRAILLVVNLFIVAIGDLVHLSLLEDKQTKTNHRRKERRKDAFSREIEENRSKARPCSDLARSCPCSPLGSTGSAQGRARDSGPSTPVRKPSTTVLKSFPRSSSARAAHVLVVPVILTRARPCLV